MHRYLKQLFAILLFICPLSILANNISESNGLPDLSTYIVSKIYTPFAINDSYGTLLFESKVVDYHSKRLYDYYLNKICDGIYIYSCNFNKQNINTNLGIDLSTESGLITLQFESIQGYKVIYTSQDMQNESHRVSGAILAPDSPQKLKGVLIFYRYTVLDKDNIASNFFGDEFQLSRLMASTFAADGYVVLMPDYLGFGEDAFSVHPYLLYPTVNALSGIYMLKILEEVIPSLKFNLTPEGKIPLFISGYSEGGSYALWATKHLEDNPNFLNKYNYKLKKTIPILGAYNLSEVTVPYVFTNVNKSQTAPYFAENYRVTAFIKPGLFANTLSSYAHYDLGNNESAVFSSKFISCGGCSFKGANYSIADLLQYAPVRDDYKYSLLYDAAYAADYTYSNNSVTPLTNAALIKDQKFLDRVRQADIYNWQAKTPINFLEFEYDSVVPKLNTETAYKAMTDAQSSWVKITRVPNQDFKVRGYLPWTDIDVDHPQGLSLMLLFARKEFDSQD